MLGGLVGAADVAASGVLLAGAGACVRLVGATWKVLNGARAGSSASNGGGEWRGRVEQILDTVVRVQDRSIAELGELRRATDRMNAATENTGATLERVATLLDAHDRRAAAATAALPKMGDQLEALYREKFGR